MRLRSTISAGLVAVACTTIGTLAPVSLAQQPTEFAKRTLEMRGGETIECDFGRIEVPENRAKPDSRKISLAFLRVPSVAEKPGPPVFMLAGGPGGSGIELVTRHVAGGGRMLLQSLGGDLVAIDQRGVGESQPNLDSRALYNLPLDQPGESKAMLERIQSVCREEARRCREQGVDLAGYTTVESAADIDAVRAALGYSKIVLWGESYGSHLALATLRRHPQIIEKLVLIGPEGPDHTLKLPSDTQKALERLAELVQADAELASTIPDFLALLRSVLDRLEKSPAYADVDGARVGIGKFDVQLLLSDKLSRTRKGIDQIPALVKSMADGDFSIVAREIAAWRRDDGVHSAMAMVMDSASSASATRLEQIARESKDCLLGDAANFPYPYVGEAWGAPDLGAEYRGQLRSEAPILIIVGDLDPRTPVRNAHELLENFPAGHLLVVTNVAHDLPWGVPDIRAVWEAFLAGRELNVMRVAGPPMKFAPLR